MSRKIAISTIVAKIKRDNITRVSTKLYEELDSNHRAIIESSIDLLSDEQLILCYYLNADYWWVITNVRILVRENQLVDSYLFDNIKSVEVNDIFVLGVSSPECNRIQLILQNGQEINLNLEYHTWASVAKLLQFLIFPRSS